MTPAQAYQLVLLALCIYREAQNQTHEAQVAVACSIRNRVRKPDWWGRDYVSVILMPKQYSSFNHNDPNATKLPVQLAPDWGDALEIANNVYKDFQVDTISGATHYYDKSLDAKPPYWVKGMVEVAIIGDLRFWK